MFPDLLYTSSLRQVRAGGVAIIAALGVAACGSSSANSSKSKNPSVKGNGIAEESPTQIIGAAQRALHSAHGFVLTAQLTASGKSVRFEMLDRGASKLLVHFTENGLSAELLELSGSIYIRADKAFWNAHGGVGIANLFANHWLELPQSAGHKFTAELGVAAPSTLATCLGQNLGTLSRAGTTTVDGTRAVVLHQAGDLPGTKPGTIAIAMTGPPYPLRLTTTGPKRPGGKIDACNTGKADDETGTATFSQFNAVPAITVPTQPLKLGSSSQQPY